MPWPALNVIAVLIGLHTRSLRSPLLLRSDEKTADFVVQSTS